MSTPAQLASAVEAAARSLESGLKPKGAEKAYLIERLREAAEKLRAA